MSLSTKYNRMIQSQGFGHGNLPVFQNPLMIGDIVRFHPAQSNPIERRFNAFHDLGMSFSDAFSSGELSGTIPLKTRFELKSSSGVSGGLSGSGSGTDKTDSGKLSFSVKFTESNSFYLLSPSTGTIAYSDRVGFAKAVRKKVKKDKNHSIGITDHIVDKVMFAIQPAYFWAKQSSSSDTSLSGTFKQEGTGSGKGSFNIDSKSSDLQQTHFAGLQNDNPLSLQDYLNLGSTSSGIFAISFSRFATAGRIVVDPSV